MLRLGGPKSTSCCGRLGSRSWIMIPRMGGRELGFGDEGLESQGVPIGS